MATGNQAFRHACRERHSRFGANPESAINDEEVTEFDGAGGVQNDKTATVFSIVMRASTPYYGNVIDSFCAEEAQSRGFGDDVLCPLVARIIDVYDGHRLSSEAGGGEGRPRHRERRAGARGDQPLAPQNTTIPEKKENANIIKNSEVGPRRPPAPHPCKKPGRVVAESCMWRPGRVVLPHIVA